MKINMKKLIKNIIFYLVVVFFLAYIFIDARMPEQTIDIFGFKSYVVVSDSMQPKLNEDRDMIIIKRAKVESIQEDDIISFYTYLPTNLVDDQNLTIFQKNVVTHYVGEITEIDGKFMIKTYGTSTPEGEFDQWKDENGQDADITEDDLIGELLIVIPYLGLVVTFFQSINFIWFALILFNLTIIYIIIKLLKKGQGEKNELG